MSVTTGHSKCGILSYIAISNILGSIKIKRTSSGLALNRIDKIIALIPTDLPAPVVPATKQCGILAKSATIGLPEMSLPKASVNKEWLSL